MIKPGYFLLIFFLFHFSGCGQDHSKTPGGSGVDVIDRAERFTIEKHDGYTVVRVLNPWQGTENTAVEYYLVKRGNKVPEGVDTNKVVFVPVRKIICMSVTHTAMVSTIGCENSICAISGTALVWSPPVRKMIDEGKIPDVGYDSRINTELIMKLSPDVLMMYGIGSESAGYVARIKETGTKIIFNADYLENDPLGKAEWIRLFGALFCREAVADSIFNSESDFYERQAALIKEKAISNPRVLLGLPYQDTWFISPGNSYISKLISDAGGTYLWNDTKSSRSMPYGLENVFMRAVKAEYWLNPGTAASLKEITAVDRRLAELPCLKNGNVFNNIKRMNAAGANDYWENGSVHPGLLLKDISEILHPELTTGSDLVFYKKLE